MTNATLTANRTCRCGAAMHVGDRVRVYHERAVSYREASANGGWQVRRVICAKCAEARAQVAAQANGGR